MSQIYHNAEIDQTYNYDDLFIRIVSVALGKTLSKSIRYINHFSDKKIRVVIPFYYGFIQENFLIDTFVDDILGKRIELDTTQRPRGIIRLKNWSPVSTEFSNPNQYLSQKTNINNELRTIISKVRAIPVNISYDIEVLLATQGDAEKVMQKIFNSFFNWQFFRIEYFGLNIDAVFTLPDDANIEISPDNVDFNQNDRYTKVTYSLNIRTYYPSFKVDVDDLQVCDNDDEIDWDKLDVPKPEEDYINMVKKYHDDKGVDWNQSFVNRVFWKGYLYESNKRNNEIYNKPVSENNKEKDIKRKSQKRPK